MHEQLPCTEIEVRPSAAGISKSAHKSLHREGGGCALILEHGRTLPEHSGRMSHLCEGRRHESAGSGDMEKSVWQEHKT